MVGFTGGDKLIAHLEGITKKLQSAQTVDVGFLEGATYPDGTPVAQVAAIQNYGAPAASIPARAFFSNMIAQKSPTWGKSIANLAVQNNYDSTAILGQMGLGISAQLRQSIIDTDSPALSPITLMLRKMKSENQSLVVSGAVVGEAARRVAAGESYSGINSKPLNDTSQMLNSVDYEVKE